MNMLRAGSTQLILGHRVMAPSTLGTFLRAFSFGHVRQLDHVFDVALARAWAVGAGPGDGPLVIDIDSFVGEVHGDEKDGAAYGYTHVLGYHPIIATPADTGEVLHIRCRTGKANTQRGLKRFVEELLARVRRAGHTGRIVIRADSGFENQKVMRLLDRRGVEFSIAIKQHKHIRGLIDQITEADWRAVSDYPVTGEAQVAETAHPSTGFRLIARRTRLVGAQADLFPNWRHHAFITNRDLPVLIADADHRDHATVELVIRDVKDQALAHFPSGEFAANMAWTVIAALAHNLARWATLIGQPTTTVQTARACRRQLLTIPGRLVHTGENDGADSSERRNTRSIWRVVMRSRRWSPKGGVQAEKQLQYVRLIAVGVSNSEACRRVGIDRKTGNRWRYGRTVRNSAGERVHYAPVQISEPRPRSPRYLSEAERLEIADLLRAGLGVRAIARAVGRAASTISRELRRNVDGDGRYRPHRAEQLARVRAGKPRPRRITLDTVLGETVAGLLAKRWSPEQVAHELRERFHRAA